MRLKINLCLNFDKTKFSLIENVELENCMRSINIHEAKTHLSQIAEEVAAGEEIIVAKAGKPKMKLVPIQPQKKKITFGLLKGKIQISEDFDAPLPEDILEAFEGRGR